jgi:hypothetical protein
MSGGLPRAVLGPLLAASSAFVCVFLGRRIPLFDLA